LLLLELYSLPRRVADNHGESFVPTRSLGALVEVRRDREDVREGKVHVEIAVLLAEPSDRVDDGGLNRVTTSDRTDDSVCDRRFTAALQCDEGSAPRVRGEAGTVGLGEALELGPPPFLGGDPRDCRIVDGIDVRHGG